MNRESHLNSNKHLSNIKILSPHFKKLKTFNSLQNQEKKVYRIISRFISNNEVTYPLSQLTEFFEDYNAEELSWKKCFTMLCLFLDHQIIRGFYQHTEHKKRNDGCFLDFFCKKSEQELLKTENNERESSQSNKKRLHNNMEDKENLYPKKKIKRNEQFEELPLENNHELFNIYLLNKLENVKNLYNQTFKNISKETEISDDAIIMEKSFYDLIGLKYTYYTTSFFNSSSMNVKKIILDKNLSDNIEVFDNINLWCVQRINQRESISKMINLNMDKNNLRSILNLSSDVSDAEIIKRCEILLKWLFLPNEDTSDSGNVFKSYNRLKEAIINWNSEKCVQNNENADIDVRNKHFFTAKSNFQKFVIEFVLDRHNEQQTKCYNPFWTLGINPKKFKIEQLSSIKKKLLLFTHPDKILEKRMKAKANEAYIIIRESLELIIKLCKTNQNIIESFPKGPELSYDFNLYLEKYVHDQIKPLEIVEMNASLIEANGKETLKLPPGIRVYTKLSKMTTNVKLKVYLTLPFMGSNTIIEKNQLTEYIFNTYFIETNIESEREDILIKLSGDCVYFEISDILFSGFPGVTELSYYIGVQVAFHSSFSKIIWKKVKTKLPTESEIIKGFSKNGIKRYLELYCRTWGHERKCVQNIFSAAKLWNVIDNTPRKAELIKVLIALMENSYKTLLIHSQNF
ncbi:hypothetical protein [Cryptosporidium parvum Iowa II]|uniref:Uncharacterized protein n=2 Tax=Cryptosporidium parvum TaxID=5807 RepID=Q5CQY2_CRYPI|nr:hypothetical protein [Cryptosporidium parvum Iowa II]EAK87822.1 hypothetical protein, possible apicomplexan conserved [Cryptosporidium parvum Iowa II]QOY42154.1 DnaJ domain containing protein [Cryptosporidium parvum]WKS77456.1 hypothetical protein CPCDC_4g2850 [Cryptosporidium sp. 43IA8]WRK31871.1 DnaJ domain containing protein [Cryptosporidium parvum]|eukprot:QOY42154.1 hypothetical protein CPATCC_001766 [Cryptosporidium parvum]